VASAAAGAAVSAGIKERDRMYFNRIEAKMAAKESIRRTQPSCIQVMLIYTLLTTGVSYLLGWFVGDIGEEIMVYLYRGYTIDQVLPHLLRENAGRLTVYGVVQLLFGLYSGLMSFGLTSYTLRVARNEDPGHQYLLDGFLQVGRVLWQNILVSIYEVLWGVVTLIPLMLLVMLFEYESVMFIAVLAYTAFYVMIVLRYALASFFLLDDPSCTAGESIRRSVIAMKGHVGEYFMLNLSFIGWILGIGILSGMLSISIPRMMPLSPILGTLVTNVCALWLIPYVAVSQANFYDYVNGSLNGQRSSGDYAGPDYDYHSSQGPEPF